VSIRAAGSCVLQTADAADDVRRRSNFQSASVSSVFTLHSVLFVYNHLLSQEFSNPKDEIDFCFSIFDAIGFHIWFFASICQASYDSLEGERRRKEELFVPRRFRIGLIYHFGISRYALISNFIGRRWR